MKVLQSFFDKFLKKKKPKSLKVFDKEGREVMPYIKCIDCGQGGTLRKIDKKRYICSNCRGV